MIPSQLHGVRIWLSGAVPPDADTRYQSAIRTFVRHFVEQAFRSGAHILHGSHPTFVPILLEEAERHISNGGRRDCLTLAVSRFWSKDSSQVPVQQWRKTCVVYETPEATAGEASRDESLSILRQWMAERCDVFIALGGMWWRELAGRAGMPIEAGMAIERQLPCFLLGGFGGVTGDYVVENADIFRRLHNGFDIETNRRLASERNIGDIVHVILDQLVRLPLVRGRVSDGISFRILALDGGGIKGAFTASVLATLEKSLKMPVAQHFDLIAGTSTGGILAIALGMGLKPTDMLKFYRERGPLVFPIMRLHRRVLSKIFHAFRPKYYQEILRRELEGAYGSGDGGRSIGNSLCRLVIPAYDAVSGACHVFRTPHHPLLKADASTDAVEVAMATAAAPTYFRSAEVRNMIANSSYFDGGVWANCPAMAAIVEAVCYLNVPLDRIDILSVGTTSEPFTVKSMADAGWLQWAKTLIDLLMNAQLDASLKHAQMLVGYPRFLRINVTTTPGEYVLDGAEQIESLISLGHSTAANIDTLSQVKSRFVNGICAIPWNDTNYDESKN